MAFNFNINPNLLNIALDRLGQNIAPKNPFAGIGTYLTQSQLAEQARRKMMGQNPQAVMANTGGAPGELTPQGLPGGTEVTTKTKADGTFTKQIKGDWRNNVAGSSPLDPYFDFGGRGSEGTMTQPQPQPQRQASPSKVAALTQALSSSGGTGDLDLSGLPPEMIMQIAGMQQRQAENQQAVLSQAQARNLAAKQWAEARAAEQERFNRQQQFREWESAREQQWLEKKFEEDTRRYGLDYALRQRDMDLDRQYKMGMLGVSQEQLELSKAQEDRLSTKMMFDALLKGDKTTGVENFQNLLAAGDKDALAYRNKVMDDFRKFQWQDKEGKKVPQTKAIDQSQLNAWNEEARIFGKEAVNYTIPAIGEDWFDGVSSKKAQKIVIMKDINGRVDPIDIVGELERIGYDQEQIDAVMKELQAKRSSGGK